MTLNSKDGKIIPAMMCLLLPAFISLFLFCTDEPTGPSPEPVSWSCVIPAGAEPDSSGKIGCKEDFLVLASTPLNGSKPGGISVKTVIDDWNNNNASRLYFQNSKKYKLHHDFASANLSGKAAVPDLKQFNNAEYSSDSRRFLLGAITYYEVPGVWAYEIAPYDNASAEMISLAYQKIVSNAYFGDSLYFHPTSKRLQDVAKGLPESAKIITTDELYQGINYQPLNNGTSIGKLVFATVKELEAGLNERDIVVLDTIPNDISATSGIITGMFQTPLSHINVLSQSRGIPNMGLRNAFTDNTLLALKGKWVKLVVESEKYSITEVTEQEANEWWNQNRCVIPAGTEPDSSGKIGCINDFLALASTPLSSSIPGAMSVKTVIDDWDNNKIQLYFQNSKKYKIHHEFTSANLSGKGKLVVPGLDQFNKTEYSSKNRRFILGAITYYEGPGVWTYEIAPYDNASAEMINLAYQLIASHAFFGDSLYFHPTSQTVENVAAALPKSVKIITTDELYKGIDYQPLNYGTTMGKLVFVTANQLENGTYVSFRDIVVLDAVPNDISVTSGIITQMFQTPLSHINVLSQNRGTPNMGLRGAFTNSTLLSLKDKWVKLVVGAKEYSIVEVTQQEADAWWEKNSPTQVSVAKMNLDVKDLRDIKDILDYPRLSFAEAIDSAIPAFGGKASNFGAFPHMDTTKVPYPRGFVIPVFYYHQFMEQNGFLEQIRIMLADSVFQNNTGHRDKRLYKLRKDMEKAPVDTAFTRMLMTKLQTEFPGIRMRFRSSTNAEDLDGFTGAGLYTSKSGDPGDPESVLEAIREVWASVWFFRAFEERSYRKIGHETVGMALLVHQSFPDEEATGVAITANPYDQSGLEPSFYINVQYGDGSVVLPDSNITSDVFVYHYYSPGRPIVYHGHSNILPEGQSTVLTNKQVYQLGIALEEIHRFFQPIYGNEPGKYYAMDTEFKFDQPIGDPNGEPVLTMKQARPYPGMGK